MNTLPYIEDKEIRARTRAFMLWAFGKNVSETGPTMEEWNKRHSNLLTLHEGDNTITSLIVMVNMYFKQKQERGMDKQINKVKKDIKKSDKPKALKDVNKLLKMDKKFDAKLDHCDKVMKKKTAQSPKNGKMR